MLFWQDLINILIVSVLPAEMQFSIFFLKMLGFIYTYKLSKIHIKRKVKKVNEMMKVLGIQSGTSKKGNKYCILHLSEELLSQYGVGEKVSTEFINDNIDISGVEVGSEIELLYGRGSGGRAYVAGIKVLE